MKDLDILPLKDWLELDNNPLYISGPCSAETEEQVLQTAREIARIPEIKVFRSGIWKPRTRPHYFEGAGNEGLKWLKKVREETGLLTAVEVAQPEHVEACLEHGIDILWIGARTVVNPFSVQEITGVLKGLDIPVMVKNPVTPDLKLWIGAIERVYKAGINKIIAVHRGFYTLQKTLFRNPPMWEIPIELKRIVPAVPVISDPSHICGNRNMLFQVAQKAMDLAMDGLMIESHIDPVRALTDPQQQVTPYQLSTILRKLQIRDPSDSQEFYDQLKELRNEIDKIDEEMLSIIARRFDVVREIGKVKKEKNITVLQIKRWKEVFEKHLESGQEKGIDEAFLTRFLELLHKESIRMQSDDV